MKPLIKPAELQYGDKVVLITLSDAEASTDHFRYLSGKDGLQKLGLNVVESKHALKSPQWIYENPQARAEDLMEAFSDKTVKAIISICGGEDSVRLLPHVDLDIIASNPKAFVGYSDITAVHYMCFKAGLSSFYGPMVMSFADFQHMNLYTKSSFIKTLFHNQPIGEIAPVVGPENNWRFLGGKQTAQGRLLGGCSEVMPFLYETGLWPEKEQFDGAVLFLETVADGFLSNQHGGLRAVSFEWFLRNLGMQGILQRLNGILFSKPGVGNYPVDPALMHAHDQAIVKILREFGREDLPVITGMDFGHKSAIMTMPFGMKVEINPQDEKLVFLESGVISA